MNLKTVISGRRSVYTSQFSGERIDEHIIEDMLELANWAPTHKHTEPWRFKVYESEAMERLIDTFKEIYIKETLAESFNPGVLEKWEKRKGQISHLIVIIKKEGKAGIPEFEEIASVSMAVQNMWLYLSSIDGLGGYWSTPGLVLGKSFAEHIGLADDEQCLGMFLAGTIKQDAIEPIGQRGDWKDKVTWYKN